jgi:peptide/nickel transport system substrate-binding protein
LNRSGALAVYDYLNNAGTKVGTFATNPLWQVVDGPWKLKSFTTDGDAIFAPNPNHSGPVKPSLSSFEEKPFTTNAAEFDVLRSWL